MKVYVVTSENPDTQQTQVLGVLEDGPELKERVQALRGDAQGDTLVFELGAAPTVAIAKAAEKLSMANHDKLMRVLMLMGPSGMAEIMAALLVTMAPAIRAELDREISRMRE